MHIWKKNSKSFHHYATWRDLQISHSRGNRVQGKIQRRELQLILSVGPFGIYNAQCITWQDPNHKGLSYHHQHHQKHTLWNNVHLNVSWPSPQQVSHWAAPPCSSWVLSQTEKKLCWEISICQNLARSALNFCLMWKLSRWDSSWQKLGVGRGHEIGFQ